MKQLLFFALAALCCQLTATPLIGQRDLAAAWGRGKLERPSEGVVRIVCEGGPRGVSALNAGSVAADGLCRVVFEARGNLKLQGMFTFGSSGRIDFFPPAPLAEEWKKFEFTLEIPAGGKGGTIHFFNWEQAGFFEIRNYQVTALRPPAPEPVMMIREEFDRGATIRSLQSETVPAGWTPEGPAAGGLVREPMRSVPYALQIPASVAGAGYLNHKLPLPGTGRKLYLQVYYRLSEDYAGNAPAARLHFFGGADTLLAFPLPTEARGQWLLFETEIAPEQIPAGTESLQLGLYTLPADGIPAGSVCFDSIRLKIEPLPGTAAKLRTDRFANWYALGETVVVAPQGVLPAGTVKLRGTVCDSAGNRVTELESSPEKWSWVPDEPGLYRIAFTASAPSGEIPLAEEFTEQAVVTNRIAIFRNHEISVGVTIPGKGGVRQELIGYQLDCTPGALRAYGDTQIRLARLVDGSFARFHVTWAQLEPEEGKLEWDFSDFYIDKCVGVGIEPVVGVYGTPRWASSTPDDHRVLVHVRGYSSVAPSDFGSWERFLARFVNRYKNRVRTWQVWNEPHLPGFSCYWIDTPENYVELLKRGYGVIKKEQPDSVVWAGGIGLKYLPFYDRIIRLGAGKYFDVLALHGHGTSAEPFYAIDRKYRSPEHPWVTSEWHASLMRFDTPTYRMSEEERNRNVMLDLFRQVKTGAERIAFFETFNLVEKESLEHYTRNHSPMNHTSGIFRRKPTLQPQLGALVMHTFSTLFSGKVEFAGEYRRGALKSVTLKSGAGPVTALWHDEETPQQPGAEFVSLIDWEGRSLKPGVSLRPGVVYYAPGAAAPGRPSDSGVLDVVRRKLELRGPSGSFDGSWIAAEWQSASFDGKTLPPRANRFSARVHKGHFELAVETADPLHKQNQTGLKLYEGDSIQFAVDCKGDGYPGDMMEFQVALSPEGPRLYKGIAPTIIGDNPVDWTPAGERVESADVSVVRENGLTRYRICLPLPELYPLVLKAGDSLRFSLLVNENDGEKRAGYYHWGDGIGVAKDPVLFGTLFTSNGSQ